MLARDLASRLLALSPRLGQSALLTHYISQDLGQASEGRAGDVAVAGEGNGDAVAKVDGGVVDGLAIAVVELGEDVVEDVVGARGEG
jgi:hypothetical protein